jgi:thymidylate kinase
MFIVLEGLSGVGKTTVGAFLAAHLGGTFVSTPPSTWAPMRATVDETDDWDARYLWYLAGVVRTGHEVLCRLMAEHVVCDRYILSTLCHHRVMGVDVLDYEDCITRFRLPRPDVTVLLVCDHDVRHRRIALRGATANDRREAAGHIEERGLAEYMKHITCSIDCTALTVEQVASRILQMTASCGV